MASSSIALTRYRPRPRFLSRRALGALCAPPTPAEIYVFPSGRILLGAVPADTTFADLVLPESQVKSTAGFREVDRQNILSALQSGFIPTYSPCSGALSTAAKTAIATSAAGAGALKIAPLTGPAAPFVAIGGAILSIFGSIFGGHGKAVQVEQATLCDAIPAANQLLTQVDQAFASGQVTASQAGTLLDQILQQYEQGVSGIIKQTGSSCNAACVYLRMLEAIVAKRKAEYKDQEESAAAAAAASPASSITAAVSSGNIGSLLPWAVGAAVLLFILK